MRGVGDLGDCLARLAIVEEDLGVGADTCEEVAAGRVAYILHELGVRLNGLERRVRGVYVVWQVWLYGRSMCDGRLLTFSYLYGAPVWKTMSASSAAVAARNGR